MGSKDILWVRKDVFGNKVSLYENRWTTHASKHEFDEIPSSEEHIYQTIVDPDFAHESLDPVIGPESCVFEKFFAPEGQRFFVPVLYDNVEAAQDYLVGDKAGKVLTGYFPNKLKNSASIGPVIWAKQSVAESEVLDVAANAPEQEQQ